MTDIYQRITIDNEASFLKDRLINVLLEFMERTNLVFKRGDMEPTVALACWCEVRRVYSGPVTVYPDFFDKLLKDLDAGFDKLHRANRTGLMKDYVKSQDFAEVMEISETLGDYIAHDRTWDWQTEFDAAIVEQQGRRDVGAFA
jgi:hypothetical protein